MVCTWGEPSWLIIPQIGKDCMLVYDVRFIFWTNLYTIQDIIQAPSYNVWSLSVYCILGLKPFVRTGFIYQTASPTLYLRWFLRHTCISYSHSQFWDVFFHDYQAVFVLNHRRNAMCFIPRRSSQGQVSWECQISPKHHSCWGKASCLADRWPVRK